MTTGEPHPAAELPSFGWPRPNDLNKLHSASLTNSRFAMLAGSLWTPGVTDIIVWDWRTGRILLVSEPIPLARAFRSTGIHPVRQETADRTYRDLKFIDEYSFVMLSDPPQEGPPQLRVIDTECRTTPTPIQTSFSFSSRAPPPSHLLSDPCGHAPSSDELTTAPFYPDPSRRILAVGSGNLWWYVINTELLLGFSREREGQNISWDDWEATLTLVQAQDITSSDCTWVSGCRLFCTASRGTDYDYGQSYLRMYDFNRAVRPKNLDAQSGTEGSKRKKEVSRDFVEHQLPWRPRDLKRGAATTVHDSIVFCVVSTLITLPPGP